jgi:exosortase B
MTPTADTPVRPARRASVPWPWQRTGRFAFDPVVACLVVLGFAALYLPTYADLARRIWPSDEQGHGPIILAVSAWLMVGKRHGLAALPAQPRIGWGTAWLVVGLAMYVLGRSQNMMVCEAGSQIVVLVALLLATRGMPALRLLWFPLFFLLFMVPLPGSVVASVTAPLKAAVSSVAGNLLYWLGYPVARSGVILIVGPYQLLVADACAGLNSMFTLEALGLLYLNMVRSTSTLRNVALAVLIIPISFVANIIRVMILVLVTYHFGDQAGQGFVHSFAGMVLFSVGLALTLAADSLLRLRAPPALRRAGA